MRIIAMLAAMAVLAACSVETGRNDAHEGAADVRDGYTLEVMADDAVHIFRVTAPDGRIAAARAEDGKSSLLDAGQIRALASSEPGPPPAEQGQVSIRVPGFSLDINGDGSGEGEHGSGHVEINANGRRVSIQGEGDGEDGNGHARVFISGVDEEEARNFIAKADQLSPQVQADMLRALGLSQE